MEVTPARFVNACSSFVPLPARSAKIFFTTRYLAPVGRSALRNSKSCVTVSLEYVATIMLEAFFNSPPSFSTAATFLARVTAIFKPFQTFRTYCHPERSEGPLPHHRTTPPQTYALAATSIGVVSSEIPGPMLELRNQPLMN